MFLFIFFIFDSRIWPYYSRNVTRSITHYTLLSFWASYITAHLENVWRDSLKDCSQNRMRNREKSALQRETHKHKIEKFFLDVNSDVFDIMCWWTHTKVCGGLDFYRRPVRMVCYTFYHRVWWLCSHVEFAEGKGKLSEWPLVSSLLAIFAKSGGSLSSSGLLNSLVEALAEFRFNLTACYKNVKNKKRTCQGRQEELILRRVLLESYREARYKEGNIRPRSASV